MKFKIYLPVMMVFCLCCGRDNTSESSKLYAESMKIHDELMPKMDESFALSKKLNQRLDSLNVDSTSNATLINETRLAIDRLKNADEHMMDWMHNIKDLPGSEGEHAHHGSHEDSAPVTEEQQIEIQKAQKAAIEQVRKDMEESIDAARSILRVKQ